LTEDLRGLDFDAGPKRIGSRCRTHEQWVMMPDPSELGSNARPKAKAS